MSRWFRHYASMARDEKLVSVAIKSKQTVERVVWVWSAILESAAEIDDDGRFVFDCAEAAYFLRADEADIRAIQDSLTNAGRLDADHVVNWSARQFISDRSAERQARHRERKKSAGSENPERAGDAVVTATYVRDWAMYDPRNGRLSSSDWRVIRSDVFDRDDYTRQYCGERGRKLECDHVLPLSRGGGNEIENLVTACFACNRAKRDKLVSEWRPN